MEMGNVPTVVRQKKLAVRMIASALILCMTLLFLLPFSVSGETQIVKVAVIDYPNFLQMREDRSITGYAYEYMKDIQKYTGWKYEFIEMSFEDATAALAAGEIDLVAGNQYTAGRADLWDYSERDMGEGGTVLCVLPQMNQYAFNDFTAFEGMKIAALRGSVRMSQTAEFLEKYGVTVEFVQFDTDAEAKESLKSGETDAILMSTIRCEADYKILAKLSAAPIYFCTNKNKPELKTELDDAMEQIHLVHPYYESDLYDEYYGDVQTQLTLTKAELSFIENSGPITVAIQTDMSPIEYYDAQTGEFKGFVVDYYKLLAKRTGLNFRFVAREDEEALRKQIDSGQVQLVGSMVESDVVAEKYDVSLTNGFYRDSVTAVINSKVEDYLDTDSTVVMKGDLPLYQSLIESLGYTNISNCDSYQDGIDQVNKGEKDITLVPTYSTDILTNHVYYNKIMSLVLPDSDYEFGIGVSNQSNSYLLSILNKGIAAVSSETLSNMIIANMQQDKMPKTSRDVWAESKEGILLATLVGCLMISAILLYNNRRRRKNSKILEELNQKANAASEAKSDFLSLVSHDMRTPMNGIIGLVHLSEEEKDPQVLRENIEKIGESSRYLLSLINDTLDMQKFDHGKMTLVPEVTNGAILLESVTNMVKSTADEKHVEFRVVTNETNMETLILVDPVRVKQIFVNLLSNAVKFTPSGGLVEFNINCQNQEGEVAHDVFKIRDTGIGMTQEFIDHKMYHPFTQQNSSLTNQYVGTGLGLSIVKRLVDLMDGTIEVESNPGEGTTFTVKLDFTRVKETDAATLQNNQLKVNLEEVLSDVHILLCEDHPLNAEIAQRLLTKMNCKVDLAVNGKFGVDSFAESMVGYYQCILMDIRMPVMDGLEAARQIRALDRPDAQTIPIVAMTANAYAEDIQQAAQAGMNEYVAKPVEPKRLYQVIAQQIQEQK